MPKYIIEGGINFYEELYKSLDNNDNNTNNEEENNNVCQITGMPLVDNYITLECSHKFNYDSLYKEICKQKYVFKTYSVETLTNSEYQKIKDSQKDYFIKCPYCRCIQFTLLPYYPDGSCESKYGINSLEKTQNDIVFLIKPVTIHNHQYSFYGYLFQKGVCCQTVLGIKNDLPVFCQLTYTSFILEMNKSFCPTHIRKEVTNYKNEKKKQLREHKLAEKQKQKEISNEKKKEKQLEKQEKKKKIPIKNIVISQNIQIGEFNDDSPVITEDTCSTILKTGSKKGQQCGSSIKQNGLCTRHLSLLQKQKQEKEKTNNNGEVTE